MSARTFAHWQAVYEEHRIPLLPMELVGRDKKPMVNRPHTFGVNGCRGLATKPKYKDVEMFGFMAGARSRVTILDIDGKDDRQRKRLLQDMQDRHGESRLIARTPSGGFHLYYRHNGEQAKVGRVRPWPGEPVDILHSGPVVAPPSKGTRAPYEIIHGTLEDLARLTAMQGLVANENTARATTGRIGHGSRNKALWEHCMRDAHHLDSEAALLDSAETWANSRLDRVDGHPFTDAEIRKIVRSAWERTEQGENPFGRGRMMMLDFDLYDRLKDDNRDAIELLLELKRRHWGRDFDLGNGASALFGWGPNRFKAARACLVRHGLIRCVHAGGRGPNDPPKYVWAKVSVGDTND